MRHIYIWSVPIYYRESNRLTEQAEEQLEAMNEEIDAFVTQTNAKKQQIIKDYTAVASNNYKGFDILDENGNYKSTYDILLGISKIYKEIQEEDKKLGTNRAVALVEELAGKNRSNVASAILSDPAQLEAVKKSSEEAFGSAQEELDKFLESIDGRMAKLSNQAQEFWYKLIDSDTIKNGITLLTELLGLATDFVDTFGALGTAGLGAGLFASFKGAGRVKIAYPHLYTYACRNKTLYAQAYFYMLPCVKYTLEFRVELTTVCNLLHSRYDIPLHYGCTF